MIESRVRWVDSGQPKKKIFSNTIIISSQSSNLSLHKLKINPKTQLKFDSNSHNWWINFSNSRSNPNLSRSEISLFLALKAKSTRFPFYQSRSWFILYSLIPLETINLPSKAKCQRKENLETSTNWN